MSRYGFNRGLHDGRSLSSRCPPASHLLNRLAKAGGKEVESGKPSVESSAALAVNTFGWIVELPEQLPPLHGLSAVEVITRVDVEYCARFPWSGGRHPWLDAVVETDSQPIGTESKRFEPYRDRKTISLSEAYDRPVWGDQMRPFEDVRDALKSGGLSFQFFDGVQLVKHAFGLVTDGRRKGKRPSLIYLFAEPAELHGKPIPPGHFELHRAEVTAFAKLVGGAEVTFGWLSYREWLASWPSGGGVGNHGDAVRARFNP